jgi:7-cyano-7-deazaguanine reductase
MMKLEVIENSTTGNLQEEHILDVPPCCPVSKNPRPGSTISIRYYPIGKSLEIASLIAYLHSFKGGLRDDGGNLVVRDMEGMIIRIAEDCQKVLGVPVHVEAHLEIVPRQVMHLAISTLE